MPSYFIILLIIGLTTLLASFSPIVLKYFKISYTIPFLVLGGLLYYLKAPLPWPDPIWDIDSTLKFSEMVVIISIMVAGLKIGLNYTWKEWLNPLRLLGITMPLFMIFVFLYSYFILDFSGALALLLAAVLSPTDPALASEIQLNEKQSDVSKRNTGVEYNLTAEAGLNDGLAFPFVYLAILWSKKDNLNSEVWTTWLSYHVLYKIVVGVVVGILIGFLYSYFTTKLTKKRESKIHQAFVAISLTLVSYGLAEVMSSYGFISVFFTGLFAHYHAHINSERNNYEPSLEFITNVEKFLIIFWMVFFGGSIMGGILNFLDLKLVLFCLCLVLVARPVLGYISLTHSGLDLKKKLAISFFGIRGIGSVFYLTYAIKNGEFENTDQLFSIIALVILISIILHGLTVKRSISKI
ncbi:Na+/H+ antiporter, CPA1 family protein [Formosa agariphila KMM 3901]|uniref:Na+/H+ antiporter, CPA1 family protein n=1 Tax=Formosa agariphila (strain DSM 15362 / KCTC 12365 / LMG 23005 / KMM 3901 / M-2Alg 35-1) TaxID=1347342 RepID=T2KKU4_FORAG|nr:cation:proton antiporter [Formosa agariphila]CDF78629.1 Na+/H+ antiporter, CPA1 family protein [Formosa agariphila KMM 3901]